MELILAPFWCHFGSQNQHFSTQKLHRFFDWFLKPFCLHFASQNPHRNPPKMNQQICPKIYTFFDWFLIDFAMIFQTIFKQFPMNFFMRGKCRNLRFTRKFSSGSRVGAFGIHQQFIQKSSKKRSKNSIGFAWIFGRFFIQKTSQNHPKINEKSVEKSTSFLIEKSSEKWSKMTPKMPPKASQNAPENDCKKTPKKRRDL